MRRGVGWVVGWWGGADVEGAGGGEAVVGELHRAAVLARVVPSAPRDDQSTHAAPVLEQLLAAGSERDPILGPPHDGGKS